MAARRTVRSCNIVVDSTNVARFLQIRGDRRLHGIVAPDIAKTHDIQSDRRRELQPCVRFDGSGEALRQRATGFDNAGDPVRTVALQTHPDLQGPKAAGQFRPEIDRPWLPAGEAARVSAQIRDGSRESGVMGRRIAHHDAAGIVGNLRPFVEIEGNRVGALDAGEQRPQRRRKHRQRAERRINMKPQTVTTAAVGDRGQIVCRAHIDTSRRAHRRETATYRRSGRPRHTRPAPQEPCGRGDHMAPAATRRSPGPPYRGRGPHKDARLPRHRRSSGHRRCRFVGRPPRGRPRARPARRSDWPSRCRSRPARMNSTGKPSISAAQRTTCRSQAIGAWSRPPQFALSPAASMSASMPIAVPPPCTQPMNRG